VRESGISAGLVYRYFTGKDDVIAAIVTERHDHGSPSRTLGRTDAMARVLIAIYQSLVLQTAWDETVDNEACVRAVELLLEAPIQGVSAPPSRR
jgi:AcrR family transcriptional regulator